MVAPTTQLRRHLRIARDRVQHQVGFSIRREPLYCSLEWELRRLIQTLRIDLVVDVGANEGLFVDRLRRNVGYQGEVVSFEPGPVGEIAERAATADPRWRVERIGLGDQDRVETLYLAVGHDLSSLHRPLETSVNLFPTVATASTTDVPVRRLDTIWLEIGASERRVFLKTDTQGHDMQVLRGCGDRLVEVSAVLLEASNMQLYEDQPSIEDSITEMRRFGFLLCAAVPVSRRMGIAIEFDCLFARPLA